jgi:hypothetical protein
MKSSRIETRAQADVRRPVMRDYTMLAVGMLAAIMTTLVVIGGTLTGM